MSRLTFALVLVYFGLVLILGVHTMADTSGQPLNTNSMIKEEQLQQQQQQQQQRRDIDLMGAGSELTPSMEEQLQQAKRLNRADPTDRMPLIIPDDGSNLVYRYKSAGGGGAGSGSRGQLSGNTNEWLERVRLAANKQKQQQQQQQRRQASNRFVRALNDFETSATGSRQTADLDGGGSEPSSGLSAPMYLVEGQDEEDKDYAFINVPPRSSTAAAAAASQFSSSDNHESAARDSLWTSEQLRDLLIAQERRNRTRKLSKLLQAIARQRAAEMSRASASERPVEVAEIREKRRRCKVDPNLGVKNLSYCDTDAYFGAADYSMRDVWDSAGRRR